MNSLFCSISIRSLSLFIYLYICLSVCLPACLPACLPVSPSLSICICIYEFSSIKPFTETKICVSFISLKLRSMLNLTISLQLLHTLIIQSLVPLLTMELKEIKKLRKEIRKLLTTSDNGKIKAKTKIETTNLILTWVYSVNS